MTTRRRTATRLALVGSLATALGGGGWAAAQYLADLAPASALAEVRAQGTQTALREAETRAWLDGLRAELAGLRQDIRDLRADLAARPR